MKYLNLPIAALLACIMMMPMISHAGYKHIEEAALCPPNPIQKTKITLQHHDQNRIELAKRFVSHLKSKGQDPSVIMAIYRASLKTDVDFDLLILKAIMESDLGRMNVAATSTARGVFQYIEPTWLVLIRRYGDEIGYPHYAKAIGMTRHGTAFIKGKNAYLKAEILALRHDPDISALIKAYQIQEETDVIRGMKKGRVTATDHYIAHMMGLGLAKEFYDMKNKNSMIAVAGLGRPEMREAARLNRVFFYQGKRPLTAKESYKKFEGRVAREFRKINAVARTKEKPACSITVPVSQIAQR